MLRSRLTRTMAVLAAALALVGAGAAIAQQGEPGTSTASVGPRTELAPGTRWPVNFPGIRGDDAHQVIPSKYRVVKYHVSFVRGAQAVYTTFTARCPGGRTLQTFAYSGSVYPQIVGRTPFIRRTTFDYVGQPSWGIVVDFNARTSKPGDTVSGTIYAVCR